MASRFELECELRKAAAKLFPKPIGKMKKHEIEHTLAAFQAKADIKASLEQSPTIRNGKAPRPIATTNAVTDDMDIHLPVLPPKRVTSISPLEEKRAYRVAVDVPKVVLPTSKPKVLSPALQKAHAALAAKRAAKAAEKAAEKAVADDEDRMEADKMLFPAVTAKRGPGRPKKLTESAPVPAPAPAPEDADDPRAARIVKAHSASAMPEKRPVGRPKKVVAAGGAGTAMPPTDMMDAFKAWYAEHGSKSE